MTKYHINPETGNPNVCAAKVKCKFASEDGVTPPHYETKEAAIKAIEALAKKNSKPKAEASKNTPKKTETSKKAELAESKVEVPVEDKSEANPVSSAVEKVEEVVETSVARVTKALDDELRGSERLEKAIKVARKASIELELRKKTLATKLRRLREKAWDSKLSKLVLKKRA